MQKKKNVPFGMLFLEIAPSPQGLIQPIYDEDLNLSVVKDTAGRLVPFVELDFGIGTHTETRIHQESADVDPEDEIGGQVIWKSLMATYTATKVSNESTDKD